MQQIEWQNFQRGGLRVATVLFATVYEKALKPAAALQLALGELGVYNFAAKRIAGVYSDVLVTGAHDADNKMLLASIDKPLANGAHLA